VKQNRFSCALNYCWGSSISTSLTTGNLNFIQWRNAFEPSSTTLPATIKDAMRLLSQLKGQYLRVDKLCISQNDNLVKKRELDTMAMIYTCAYATIVAAQGVTANKGLRGIPGGTAPAYHSYYSTSNSKPVSRPCSTGSVGSASFFEEKPYGPKLTPDAREIEKQS
jgi:hypothetical protein